MDSTQTDRFLSALKHRLLSEDLEYQTQLAAMADKMPGGTTRAPLRGGLRCKPTTTLLRASFPVEALRAPLGEWSCCRRAPLPPH